jgi:hypothetical protein
MSALTLQNEYNKGKGRELFESAAFEREQKMPYITSEVRKIYA